MKILLVEDEPYVQEAIANVLESTGITVVKTDNINDAKNLLSTDKFNLLITDLYLPQPDGFELVNFVKNNIETKHIPVIVISGRVPYPETLSAPVPADEWLAKPFGLDELRKAIGKYIPIEA